MISFRYHLLSIVAVFVALAVGILIGGTLLKPGFEAGLKAQVTQLSRSLAAQEQQTRALQAELAISKGFAVSAAKPLMAGQLAGEQVVLVIDPPVDPSTIAGVRSSLETSKASLQGVILLDQKLSLSDAASRATLAEIIGVPVTTPAPQMIHETAIALARRLVEGPPSDPANDVLAQLQAAGFVSVSNAPNGVAGVGGPGQSGVTLAAGSGQTAVDPAAFFGPFADTFASDGRAIAATEPLDAVDSYLQPILSTFGLNGKIVTVDDIDLIPGQVAMVLGLRDLIQTGTGGNYGVNCGSSCSLVPG